MLDWHTKSHPEHRPRMNDSNTLETWLFKSKPWSDEVEAALIGFEQPEKAWQILSALRKQGDFEKLYPNFFSSFINQLIQSYNADIALNNFERLAEEIPDKDHLYSQLSHSSPLLEALTVLFSGSQMLTDTLLRNPSMSIG